MTRFIKIMIRIAFDAKRRKRVSTLQAFGLARLTLILFVETVTRTANLASLPEVVEEGQSTAI